MDIKAMLKGQKDCPCNRVHTCDIHDVEIGNGVLERLPDICASFQNIVLVADENTYPLCGDKVVSLLGDKIVSKMIFGKEIVVPNEASIAAIEAKMPENTDLLLDTAQLAALIVLESGGETSRAEEIATIICKSGGRDAEAIVLPTGAFLTVKDCEGKKISAAARIFL